MDGRKTIGISFILIDNPRRTRTKFYLNWKGHKIPKIDEVRMFLTADGEGIFHELIELTLIQTVLEVHPNVINYPWHYSRNLFHTLANLALEE